MSYEIYIKTYDFSSWLWILFCAFVVPTFLALILYPLKISNRELQGEAPREGGIRVSVDMN